MNRRSFIALLGAGALACTRRAPALDDPFGDLADELDGTTRDLNVFLGGGEFLAARDQRVTFGLVGADGLAVEGGAARAWIGSGTTSAGPSPVSYRSFSHAPAGDSRGFHVATLPFPGEGIATILVEHDGHWGTAAAAALARPHAPGVGARAIRVATPTTQAARGVAHVCTREPVCPMHAERLDRALDNARPVVFTVGSPKFCTSRTCGPVVEEVIALRARHRDRVSFIHAEPFRDDQARIPSATFDAWRLQSEPWTFVIDGRGRIAARFEGPVVADEVELALRPVLPA